MNTEAKIKALLQSLSIEEKVNIVIGRGQELPGVSEVIAEDKVSGAAGYTFPVEHLGIPSIVLADGPAGLKN